MIKLSNYMPAGRAFGFENPDFNNKKEYEKVYKADTALLIAKQKALQGNITDLSPEIAQIRSQRGSNRPKTIETASKITALLKILGYIVFVGSMIGVYRIASAVRCDADKYPNKFRHIVRGSLEVLGLGIFLAIFDIAITRFREYAKSESYILAD